MRALLFWTVAALVLGLAALGFALRSPDQKAPVAANSWLAGEIASADAGDVGARARLARRALDGDGMARDPAQALAWAKTAAAEGSATALAVLGALYETGEAVRQDSARAAEYYRAAIRLADDADAAFALGRMALAGRGVAHDQTEAARLFARAARQGHPAAQFYMGIASEEGWLTGTTDPVAAYVWYSLALEHAASVRSVDSRLDPEAARGALAARMLRYQLQQAERRLAELRGQRR